MNETGISSAVAVHRLARVAGETRAVVSEDGDLTFAELSARVRVLAADLAAGGVRPGYRVAYLGLNSPLLLETLLAAAHVGAIFVPVNYRLAADEVAHLLTDAGCHTAVVEDGHRELVDGIAGDIPVRRYVLGGKTAGTPHPRWERRADHAPERNPVAVGPDDVAILMYTSGTTGRPKGVMLTHGNLWWNQVNVATAIDIRPREATLVAAPMFHIGGLNAFTLGTLTRGGTVVVRRRFDRDGCLADLQRYRIASVFMVPVMFAELLRADGFADADLSALRAAVVAGAPVPPRLVREYASHGIWLQEAWGLTETAPFATYLPPHLVAEHAGSAGFPMPYCEVCVRDPETGRVVTAPGERGELCVRGPNVTVGYWNNPEATAAVLDEAGWFRTGDIGYRDELGMFSVVDRLTEMIISGGENVYPAEIERVLAEFPGVREVGVVGVPHPAWGETPVAALCQVDGQPATVDEVRAFAARYLARFKLPTAICQVPALPRNGSGKVDRAVLRAQVIEQLS